MAGPSRSVTVETGIPQETATPTETFFEVPHTAKNGKQVFFYTTTGKNATAEEFQAAGRQYDTNETTPPGFTALEKGTNEQIQRSRFETVNQKVQSGARAVDAAIMPGYDPTPTHYRPPGLEETATLVQPSQPGGHPLPRQQRAPDAGGPAQYLAEQVNTPGKAGLAGALALLTGGTGNLVKATTMGVPTALRAIAGGLGSYVADKVTGTYDTQASEDVINKASSQALLAAGGIVATEGIIGLIAKGFRMSLSNRSHKGVVDDIYGAMVKKHPELRLSGQQGIEAYASTEHGLHDIIQAGVKGLKGDADELGKSFVADINTAMPRAMSKSATERISVLTKEYEKQATKMLDNIGDAKIEAATRAMEKNVNEKITDIVATEFKAPGNQLNQNHLDMLARVWQKYEKGQERFHAFAETLKVLKESGEGAGFDAQRFQQTLYNRLKGGNLPPSDLMSQIKDAAVRGGKIGSQDKPWEINLGNWIQGPIGKYMPGVKLPVTTYTGKVRGGMPWATIDTMTNGAMKDFATREPDRTNR